MRMRMYTIYVSSNSVVSHITALNLNLQASGMYTAYISSILYNPFQSYLMGDKCSMPGDGRGITKDPDPALSSMLLYAVYKNKKYMIMYQISYRYGLPAFNISVVTN